MDKFWILKFATSRVGLVVYLLLAAAVVVYVCFAGPRVERITGALGSSPAARELVAELRELRGAWDPRSRERILIAAPERASRFAGPLHRLLRCHEHELLGEAAEYAGAMGDVELREAVVAVATGKGSLPPQARLRAVRAAHRLGPWSREHLAEFLARGSTPLKLAALQICAGHENAPWPEIMRILTTGEPHGDGVLEATHADWKVLREAVIRTVPEQAPLELQREIWEIVARGEVDPSVTALRALARVRPAAEVRTRLEDSLDRMQGRVLQAALDTLGSWRGTLERPAVVWEIAQRHDLDVHTRGMALHCLERTGSFDRTALRRALPTMPAILQYFVGRCLLSDKQVDGFLCLLELVEVDEGQATELSRQLLSWMTGQRPGSTRAVFEAHQRRGMAALSGRSLPLPELGESGAEEPTEDR